MKKKNSNKVKKSIVKKITHLSSSNIKSIAKQLDIETEGRLKDDLIDSISSITTPEEIDEFQSVEKSRKSKIKSAAKFILSVLTLLGLLLGLYADAPPFFRDFGRYIGILPGDSNTTNFSHIAKTDVKILYKEDEDDENF